MKTSVVCSALAVGACLCSALVPKSARARTVALWPIEWNENTQWIDARCRIDSANDFTCQEIEYRTNDTPGTELPPNPSADVPEDFACNYISYHAKPNSPHRPHYTSYGTSGAGRYMALTNDFTVELFFKVDTLPAAGGCAVLAGYNAEEIGGDRWFASLHRTAANTGNDEFYWHIYGEKRTPDVNSTIRISAAQAADYFSRWHHAAFVFNHDRGDGTNWTGLYIDSVLVCEGSQPVVTKYPTQAHQAERVDFGGRGNSHRLYGSIDYIRISDVALTPGNFLVGGNGTWHLRGGHRTVAYWPLDSRNGVVDGRNVLGGSPLQMLVKSANKTSNYLQMRVSPDTHKAFAGSYPPNLNMEPAPTLDMPDNGSVRQQAAYGDSMRCTCLYDATVGTQLSLTNDFTVEGWFMPERRRLSDIQLIFASDQAGNSRWHLNLWRSNTEGWRLVLYANDGTSSLQPDVVLATDAELNDWVGTWRHLAIVHTADGGSGKGTWNLYLDGNLIETVEDVAVVNSSYKPMAGFTIGGRWNVENRAFVGCIDQVRVCRAALRPTQFLNAQTGAETATNVLRYWPLNVQDGVGVDGRDATRQGADLSALWNANQLPVAYASAPSVTNPDPALAGRSSATGSTRFCDPSGNGADKREYSSLATFDRATLELFNSKRAMTLEYFYRSFRDAACGNTRCLLCFVDNPQSGAWTWRGLFNYRDADDAKFHFQEGVYGGVTSDTKLGDVSMVYDGKWHHVAIVRAPTATGFTFTLYQDGIACGTVSSTSQRDTPNNATAMVVGGRWWTNTTSMDGALSSIRVTDGALAPWEFLNASSSSPKESTGTSIHLVALGGIFPTPESQKEPMGVTRKIAAP